MIRFCTCIGGSSSPLNHKQQESSKTCNSCGGKLSVDGRGALSESMLSTLGSELARVIDPHLNWKTASKGRQRAVRRARTSFTRGNKKSMSKSSKESEDLTDQNSHGTCDIAVSDSEKLGVSILGRRFGDTLESVPIKKRRFLFVRSPSPPPPPQLSSHSDDSDSDQMRETQPASHEEVASIAKNHTLDINSGGIELDQERSFVDEKMHLADLNEKLCDSVDFSGISILAAAACDCNLGCDDMKDEGHTSKDPELEENEETIHLKEDLDSKTDIHPEVSTALALPDEGSDGNKVNGSCNLDTSVNSLQSLPKKTSRVELSISDDRLNWDLNTVMDVWESHSDEFPNSEPLSANIIGEVHDEKQGNVEPHQDQMGSVDSKLASQSVNRRYLGSVLEDNCGLKETKVQGKPDCSGDASVADPSEEKECFFLLHGDDPVQEEHASEDMLVAMVDAAEETTPLHDQENSSFNAEGISSVVRDALVPTRDSSSVTAVVDEEKADVCSIEVSHSHPVPCENTSFKPDPHALKPHVMDQIAEVVSEKKTFVASAADLDDSSAHCRRTDVHMWQATHLMSPQAEKYTYLQTDSGNDKTDCCPVASHPAEEASAVMGSVNICEDMMNTAGISGESAHVNALDEIDCKSANKLKESSMSTFPSDSHALNSQGLSNHDELSSGGACASEHESKYADMKMQDNKCSVLIDGTLETTKVDTPVHTVSEVPICSSEQEKPGMVDVLPVDGALNSHGACKSYGDGCATSTGQVALEDHSDIDYYSDDSQVGTDKPTGMEKVELLGDEDYQYEDGEFRESFVNRWGEEGAEEEESEYVDYGSDNEEMDISEAVSDVPPLPEHVDGVESKIDGPLCADQDIEYGAQVGKVMQHAVSQPLVKCSLEAESAKRRIRDGGKKLGRDAKDVLDSEVSDKVIGEREFLNKGDASWKSSHLVTSRMKLSGWDRLPEGCRGSGGGVLDSGAASVSRNHADASFDASNAGGSMRRVVGSSRRDLPSRVERPKPSDVHCRKDNSNVKASRSNGLNDLNSRVERDTCTPRSIGRGDSTMHMHSQGRNDNWVDSPDYHHDSRVCYGISSFTHPASKNAAAATVAKLESNGFVVAADGTILKAGSVRSAGRVPKRSTKVSSQSANRSLMGRGSSVEKDRPFGMLVGIGNSREASPDRHISVDRSRAPAGRCGSGMVSTGHRERYHGSVPDDSRDAPLPLQRQLSRRDQSFSPHRRPLHRSQTRSPLRSRTRSPRMCTSPRGRNDGGMNGGPGLHPLSRSTHLSEVRTQRPRSPHRRSGLVERMVGYVPSSRNHTSPPHVSRWLDERNNHFREYEPHRFSGRSPPRRTFSGNRRLDPMDTGRVKSNEYFRSMHSGSFPEFGDFVRGYDGPSDGRRDYGNRYEMLQSVRQYDADGNMKRFGYDAEDGFRVHNPQPRSSKFQQRGSPRGFDRGIENQLGDSPRRVKEEKVNVRYVREGKHDAGFKSFGARDPEDDTTSRRRRPS